MAGLFLDIFIQRRQKDPLVRPQPRPRRLHQGHGVFDVVIGLGEVGDIGLQGDLA